MKDILHHPQREVDPAVHGPTEHGRARPAHDEGQEGGVGGPGETPPGTPVTLPPSAHTELGVTLRSEENNNLSWNLLPRVVIKRARESFMILVQE